MEKIILTGCTPEEITQKLQLSQSFRGKQIFKWISTGVDNFDSMIAELGGTDTLAGVEWKNVSDFN